MLAWLATYLIHSTVLILGVWGFTRWCVLDSLTRSLLWKLALVGGLFTATLQTGFGVRPALGTFALESPAPAVPEVLPFAAVARDELAAEIDEDVDEALDEFREEMASELVVLEIEDGGRSVTIVSMVDAGPAWAPEPVLAPAAEPSPPVAAAPASPVDDDSEVSAALIGLFLGGAALGLGRVLLTARRLQRLLHGRGAITRGPLAERLAALLTRARIARQMVRLTMSPALVSPIALASREIVVPEAALELEGRQQEAMLAHELAHVVRNDPAWLVLAAVIEAALFIQPLNRLARSGMQTAAEELADDWAVRHLGTGLHLARCLTEVAEWQGRGRVPGAFVSPMASGERSALVHRVQRLLGDRVQQRGRWTVVRRGLLGVGLIAAVAWGAPGMAVAHDEHAADLPEVITVAEAPEAATMPEVMPVLALADAGAPVLALADAATESDADTPRERRKQRRAARLERRAEKAAHKAAELRADGGRRELVVVRPGHLQIDDGAGSRVVVVHDERGDAGRRRHTVVHVQPGHQGPQRHVQVHRIDADEIRRQALAGRPSEAEIAAIREGARRAARIDRAELDRLRDQARELAREARRGHRASEAEIEALRREAEALARNAPRFSPAAIARLQREARRLAERAPGLSAEDLERLEEEIEAEVERNLPDPDELEAQVRRSLPDPDELERQIQRSLPDAAEIEAQVRRSLPDPSTFEDAVRRAVEQAGLAEDEQ
ncbi:MAG: hypothetical protein JNL82_17680, partial [Myxococcales bacterium]|nr:hypothetical protein [Myxococcales bacterium]